MWASIKASTRSCISNAVFEYSKFIADKITLAEGGRKFGVDFNRFHTRISGAHDNLTLASVIPTINWPYVEPVDFFNALSFYSGHRHFGTEQVRARPLHRDR